MMRKSRRNVAMSAAALGAIAVPAVLPAQVATFLVDPSSSSLQVSGTVLGVPIQQQGPGSLSATYQGPLLVQLAPDSIHFPGGSAVSANISGNWQPLPGGAPGSAPANYGAQVTILFQTSRAAVRDAVFDATTASPLPLSGGTFSSAVDFTATSGTIDYNSPLAGAGSSPLAGSTATNNAASPGTLNIAPGTGASANATLGLPVAFTITGDLNGVEGVFNFNGSFTARATAAAGDANFDGRVNLTDFNALAANFGQSGQSWLSGDFTFDGLVNLADFNLLAQNFGMVARGPQVTGDDWGALASAVVPEPATVLLAPLAGIGLLSRRRRRRR